MLNFNYLSYSAFTCNRVRINSWNLVRSAVNVVIDRILECLRRINRINDVDDIAAVSTDRFRPCTYTWRCIPCWCIQIQIGINHIAISSASSHITKIIIIGNRILIIIDRIAQPGFSAVNNIQHVAVAVRGDDLLSADRSRSSIPFRQIFSIGIRNLGSDFRGSAVCCQQIVLADGILVILHLITGCLRCFFHIAGIIGFVAVNLRRIRYRIRTIRIFAPTGENIGNTVDRLLCRETVFPILTIRFDIAQRRILILDYRHIGNVLKAVASGILEHEVHCPDFIGIQCDRTVYMPCPAFGNRHIRAAVSVVGTIAVHNSVPGDGIGSFRACPFRIIIICFAIVFDRRVNAIRELDHITGDAAGNQHVPITAEFRISQIDCAHSTIEIISWNIRIGRCARFQKIEVGRRCLIHINQIRITLTVTDDIAVFRIVCRHPESKAVSQVFP